MHTHFSRIYGPAGYRQAVQKALGEDQSAEKIRALELAVNLADAILRWPQERVKALEQPPKIDTLHRGGY